MPIIVNTEPIFDTLTAALGRVKYEEAMADDSRYPCYVVRLHTGEYQVIRSMPLLGEWYTSDGIRHG